MKKVTNFLAILLFFTTIISCSKESTSSGVNGSAGYNCVSGKCGLVGSNAQYQTLVDCQSKCSNTNIAGYNCVSGGCVSVSNNAQYQTLAACQSNCGVSSAGFNCVSGSCVSVSNNAQYTTLSACQSNCAASSAGYNCVNGYCASVTSNAQYPTFAICQSNCGSTSYGQVDIITSWTKSYGSCNYAYSVVIGLGYTSTDVANEAYFANSGQQINSPTTYNQGNLKAGIYYYKAKKTYNASSCGTGQGIPPTVIKSGSFTIIAGQKTSVNVGSLN